MAEHAAGSRGRADTWVVVPLRGLEAAKSRLGGQLDAEERLDLVTGLLERTLAAATGCGGVDRVLLVSPDLAALELGASIGVETLREPGRGLNAALRAARDHAVAHGATTLLVLPADLPRVSPEAIGHVIAAADTLRDGTRHVVAMVPDRHGGGTNALLLSPPDTIPFTFGPGSSIAHRAAAIAAGAALVELDGELTLDVDTPDDLLLAEVALSPAEHVDSRHHGTVIPLARSPSPSRVEIVALDGIPEIRPGDDLAALIIAALQGTPGLLPLRDDDVLVVTQKVVSKAEGAMVDLTMVQPRAEATEYAARWDRDARQVEVVLREAVRVVRMANGVIITETPHGFVCANGGIDASNLGPGSGSVVTLLPVDADASARGIRTAVRERLGRDVPVIVSDSFGRPWRWGIVDVAIGVSGLEPLEDLRGFPDHDGRVMRSTVRAVADELASAAELALGKSAGRPVAVIRGATFARGETAIRDALIPGEMDLFR